MIRIVAAALAAVIAAGCGTGTGFERPSPAAGSPPATGSPPASAGDGPVVVAVIDGDTLDVRIGGAIERVRLIGINAAESDECFADAATQALTAMVAGRRVTLVTDTSDRDRFGRLLRYVLRDGTDVNATLVGQGYAIARAYPPDTARADAYATEQATAQRTGAGMWGPDGCRADRDDVDVRLHVEADPPGDDNADRNGEWLDIRNVASDTLDIGGWTVKDESATHRYTFGPGTVVASGANLRLHTGCGDDTAAARYWCNTSSAVWNNGGDTAFLLDADGLTVATYTYGR